MSPLVSVLMPVFNCETYVIAAMSSILQQSFSDLELVVISDGSTDGTNDLISRVTDRRVRVHIEATNHGIAAARNQALRFAKGKYLAWLDSDDIAHPDRLGRQVEFLDRYSTFGLVASNARSIDEDGNVCRGAWWTASDVPTDWEMLWGNPIAQSTVMLRREVLDWTVDHYDQAFITAEDYDLWCRLARTTRFFRLSEVLLDYRVRQSSAFRQGKEIALKGSLHVNRRYLEWLVGDAVPDFHAYLTSFKDVLPPQERTGSPREIWRWMELARSSMERAKRFRGTEIRAAKADERTRYFEAALNCGPAKASDHLFVMVKTPGKSLKRAWNGSIGWAKSVVKRMFR